MFKYARKVLRLKHLKIWSFDSLNTNNKLVINLCYASVIKESYPRILRIASYTYMTCVWYKLFKFICNSMEIRVGHIPKKQ